MLFLFNVETSQAESQGSNVGTRWNESVQSNVDLMPQV